MSERKSITQKSGKIITDALKKVKGEDVTGLIEDFTSEMTLVAEGLCEDQSKLRSEVKSMMNEEDRRLQKQESRISLVESTLEEQQRENDAVVTELRNRIAALEKKNNQLSREKEKKKERNWLRDATVLVIVTAVSVIAVAVVLKVLSI